MIEQLAGRLASSLKEALPEQTYSLAKLKFGFHLLLNTVFTIFTATVIGLALGQLKETMLCLFAFALLRVISGGYHFSSALLCVLVSAVVSGLLPFIEVSNSTLLIIDIINLVLVIIYAPSRIKGQTRIPQKYYPLLKLAAFVIICINFFVHSPLLGLTWLVQAISLIRFPLRGGEGNEKKRS
jgi:accessory gene regulator B